MGPCLDPLRDPCGQPFHRAAEVHGWRGAALARLREIFAKCADTRIVAAGDGRLQVEFRTFLGFVDDGLFVLGPRNGVIQVRSAARVGYWGLAKNRRRMEEIRREFSGDGEGSGRLNRWSSGECRMTGERHEQG